MKSPQYIVVVNDEEVLTLKEYYSKHHHTAKWLKKITDNYTKKMVINGDTVEVCRVWENL